IGGTCQGSMFRNTKALHLSSFVVFSCDVAPKISSNCCVGAQFTSQKYTTSTQLHKRISLSIQWQHCSTHCSCWFLSMRRCINTPLTATSDHGTNLGSTCRLCEVSSSCCIDASLRMARFWRNNCTNEYHSLVQSRTPV